MNRRRWLIVLALLHLPVLYGLSLWPASYGHGYFAARSMRKGWLAEGVASALGTYLKPSQSLQANWRLYDNIVSDWLSAAWEQGLHNGFASL